MLKRTFVLDEDTVERLDRIADRLGVAKSQVVREAIARYGEEVGRLTDEERDRLLAAFDELVPEIPARPRAEVERELEAVLEARRQGGRAPAP